MKTRTLLAAIAATMLPSFCAFADTTVSVSDVTTKQRYRSDGYYWSSVPCYYCFSLNLYFNLYYHDTYGDIYYRYGGQSVRPVQGFAE